ncbi:MAG: hypothetical protein HW380_466 [Magnetococcales bacterium]|nr:hypothetical protein [Magnetococcales bacterium]
MGGVNAVRGGQIEPKTHKSRSVIFKCDCPGTYTLICKQKDGIMASRLFRILWSAGSFWPRGPPRSQALP